MKLKLALIDEDGVVLDDYEGLEETDLSKPLARADVMIWLEAAVENAPKQQARRRGDAGGK